jgi:hypothetical protein
LWQLQEKHVTVLAAGRPGVEGERVRDRDGAAAAPPRRAGPCRCGARLRRAASVPPPDGEARRPGSRPGRRARPPSCRGRVQATARSTSIAAKRSAR